MITFTPKGVDPVVESRARDQAAWLIRDHGDDAEDVLAAKMQRENLSPADLYRYRLTAKKLKSLRQREDAREAAASTDVTVWQPRLFSTEGLFRLFGVRAVDRRKRPR